MSRQSGRISKLVATSVCAHCLNPFNFGDCRRQCNTCMRYTSKLKSILFSFIFAFNLYRTVLCHADWFAGKRCLSSDPECYNIHIHSKPPIAKKEAVSSSSSDVQSSSYSAGSYLFPSTPADR